MKWITFKMDERGLIQRICAGQQVDVYIVDRKVPNDLVYRWNLRRGGWGMSMRRSMAGQCGKGIACPRKLALFSVADGANVEDRASQPRRLLVDRQPAGARMHHSSCRRYASPLACLRRGCTKGNHLASLKLVPGHRRKAGIDVACRHGRRPRSGQKVKSLGHVHVCTR